MIDHRLDLAPCQDVVKDGDCAVAETDAFREAFLDECLHACPDDVARRRKDLPIFTLPVNPRALEVHQVQIYVVEFQLLDACSNCTLYVVLFCVPKFRRDK